MPALRALKKLGLACAWLPAAAAYFMALCGKMHDPDLWWQLASGREMAARRALLDRDVFSHTMAGASWVNFEWLSQLLLYWLHQAAGMRGIHWAAVSLSLLAIALVAAAGREQGARGPGLLLCSWLAFALLRPRLMARAELLTFDFLAALVLLLLRSRRSARLRGALPWVAGGLTALWCNLHGGFVYGLAVLLLFDVGARWAGDEPGYVRALDRACAFAAACALANPYGPRLFSIFRDHLAQLGRGPSLIQEWRPADVSALPVFWAAFAACGAAVSAGLVRGWRPARFWAPAVAVFAAWGGLYYRNSALLAFVGVPFLAGVWGRLAPSWGWRGEAAGWACAALALLPLRGDLLKRVPSDPVDWRFFPVRACRFIEERGIEGRMYNAYDFGGYIDWALGPRRPVFMDGRYLFYALLEEDARLDRRLGQGLAANPWPDYLRRRGVDYAVMDYQDLSFSYPGAPFSLTLANLMFPRSEWALVFWDDSAMVFLRRERRYADQIRRFEYRALWPYNPEQTAYLIADKEESAASARRELDRHRKEVGFTVLGQRLEQALTAAGSAAPGR